jgi:hypothetical protein
VFGSIIFSKIFRSQKEEVIRRWRGLHKEELRYLYYSPNIITGITSRLMKLGRHVARMWKKEKHAELWWGNLIDRTWKTQA